MIRDCPEASNSYPFNQTGKKIVDSFFFLGYGQVISTSKILSMYLCPVSGDAAFAGGMPVYGQAYWQGNTLPQLTLYGNMYGGAQGMMHYDSTMAPISPFGMSPYMSSMYTGMPGP